MCAFCMFLLLKLWTYHSLFPEVDANCGNELRVELVVCVAVKERGLAHTGVPQGKELYKVVIIPISHSDDCNKSVETDRDAWSHTEKAKGILSLGVLGVSYQ